MSAVPPEPVGPDRGGRGEWLAEDGPAEGPVLSLRALSRRSTLSKIAPGLGSRERGDEPDEGHFQRYPGVDRVPHVDQGLAHRFHGPHQKGQAHLAGVLRQSGVAVPGSSTREGA